MMIWVGVCLIGSFNYSYPLPAVHDNIYRDIKQYSYVTQDRLSSLNKAGIKLIFIRGFISIMMALKGPNYKNVPPSCHYYTIVLTFRYYQFLVTN